MHFALAAMEFKTFDGDDEPEETILAMKAP
jgi:hypothetical protein